MADDPTRGHDDHDKPRNPLEEFMRQFGINPDDTDIETVMAQVQGQMKDVFAQLRRMAQAEEGAPILDASLVATTARQTMSAEGGDPAPTKTQAHDLRIAVELADGWLGEQTTAFASTSPTLNPAWTRQQWLSSSMPRWTRITEPIVTHMADALQELGSAQMGQLPQGMDLQALGLDQIASHLRPLMRRAAGSMFAAQMGEALGRLATQVLSSSDLGLPITSDHHPALVASNVAAFVDDLGADAREVQIYLALREVARQRLFTHVAWLEPQVIALVEHYAREIRIDPSALERAFEQIQQLGPHETAITIDGSVFEPERTPQQVETLARLETLTALVEGWVDDVVTLAAAPWIPNAPALGEAVRRRRAAGGPTEQALEALVGLEMRPRRVRDATNLWAALREARGIEGRDAVWQHPDLLPTPEDLDDILGYVQGDREDQATQEMDDEFRRLLEAESGEGS